MGLEGSRIDVEERLLWSHLVQAQGPAALSQAGGHGRVVVVTATKGAAIAGTHHGDSRVPKQGKREGNLFK